MKFVFLDGKNNNEIKYYINDAIESFALYLAEKGNLEIIKYLAEEKNLNLNLKNSYGKSLLFKPCENGNLELVKYLVEHGADVNAATYIADTEYETVLHYACKSGNLELVKYLAEHGADVNAVADGRCYYYPEETILFNACRSGNLQLVKYLVEEKKLDVNFNANCGEKSLLFAACESGKLELIKYLIEEKKLDVNDIDANSGTVLSFAKDKNNKEIVDYLISVCAKE